MGKAFMMNKDCDRREQLIFGEPYDAGNYLPDGCRFFSGMGVETLRRLVDEHFADPAEYEDDTPGIGEFLEYGLRHENAVFGGYAVGIGRDDYRVAINAVGQEFGGDGSAPADFAGMFYDADEFSLTESSGSAWWD